MHIEQFLEALIQYQIPHSQYKANIYRVPYVDHIVGSWTIGRSGEVDKVLIHRGDFEVCKKVRAICLLHGIAVTLLPIMKEQNNERT